VASCVVLSYVFLWLHVLFDLICFCGFIYCLILCVFVASCVVWSYVFLWLHVLFGLMSQKHIRSNNTWSHKNTSDQTTHEATKTHKIKQHMKPQKHIRSNNTWSHSFMCCLIFSVVWLHVLFDLMCFCGFICCLILCVFVASWVVWSDVFRIVLTVYTVRTILKIPHC
jgi:hypothetical protein